MVAQADLHALASNGEMGREYQYTPATAFGGMQTDDIGVAGSFVPGNRLSVSALPMSLGLAGLLGDAAPGWELIFPLMVTLDYDEAYYLVSDDLFDMYGTGDTISAAIRDYVGSLVELYQLVKRDADQGKPHARDELNRLLSYLRHL